MSLAAGARLGPYEIGDLLGSGGMGEVYRARDTRLNRDVAIKLLPEAFAQDAERLKRFAREAQTLASLNHPRIAQIYGLEEQSNTRGLVMELVEGPTLADRIARGALAIDDAVAIAIQIAEALEAAHDRGIVHRDLKPANVKVTADGQVKVLDFGLAKGADDGTSQSAASLNSPTITSPSVTHHGVILGTAAYMAPEQARGKPVDRRADLWALGCVLYEMLTGRRPFDGETVTDILGAVVHSEPAWERLPKGLPANVERVLRRCLRKDARVRVGHASAVLIDLQDGPDRPIAHPVTSTWRAVLPWALAGLALAAAAATALLPRSQPGLVAALPPIRSDILLPDIQLGNQFAVSPDGRFVAYLTRGNGGLRSIALRNLATGESRRFVDTDSATGPFWSPDSRRIGYFVRQQRLKILDLETGVAGPTIIEAPASINVRAAWSSDGTIIFGARDGIVAVREDGGSPRRLTALRDGEAFHVDPQFLPDGRRFLFSAVSADRRSSTVFMASTAGDEISRVVAGAGSSGYADGHLFYERDGRLHGQRLDLATLTPTGSPLLIAPEIARDARSARLALSVSPAGVLLFRDVSPSYSTRLVEFERSGKSLRQLATGAALGNLALSPDGTRIAFNAADETGRRHIWTLHLQRETQVRISGVGSFDHDPVWSPDGTEIIYGSDAADGFGIYRQPSAGGGRHERIIDAKSTVYPNTWSRDGRLMIYTVVAPDTARDLWLYSFVDRSSRVWAQTRGADDMAEFSPDGRWVAFASDQSGRIEIYVRSMDGSDREWQVTNTGGAEPHWRDDGKELYYLDASNDVLMAVDVIASATGIEFGKPRQLFELSLGDVSRARYAITSHGQRVIVASTDPAAASAPARMIVNWQRLFAPAPQ